MVRDLHRSTEYFCRFCCRFLSCKIPIYFFLACEFVFESMCRKRVGGKLVTCSVSRASSDCKGIRQLAQSLKFKASKTWIRNIVEGPRRYRGKNMAETYRRIEATNLVDYLIWKYI